MKINELIEMMNQSKIKALKEEQTQVLLKKTLNVKEYLSIKEKKQLVENIVDECILYDDGVFKFDEIEKYVCFTMRIIETYTDLELSEDMEEDYDALCKAGILNSVVNTFKEEYDSVNILLQMRCDYILSSNAIEAQFGRFLGEVSDKLDIITKALTSKVDEFNLNELITNINPENITKLLSIVKSIK